MQSCWFVPTTTTLPTCRLSARLGAGYQVERFVEKPDLETARAFLADGGYSWNGGIFAFRAGAFLGELTRFRPDIAKAVSLSVEQGREEDNLFHPGSASFAQIDGESVDYAVMECTARAAMVPVSMGWSDTMSGAQKVGKLRGATDQ